MSGAQMMNYMTTPVVMDSLFVMAFAILVILCVAFLIMMDVVRLYSGWPTRGLVFLALFGFAAVMACMFDNQTLPLFSSMPLSVRAGAGQLLFLWSPFLLMLYYVRVVRENYRRRMLWILWFDAGLAAFLTALFVILPKERVVSEVYAQFMLALSAAFIVVTLIQWHGAQKGYRRIYWESAAVVILVAAAAFRFAEMFPALRAETSPQLVRIGGLAVFMLTMTGMQFYAILMEYRMMVNRTKQELEQQNAKLLEARDEAERARHEVEVITTEQETAIREEAVPVPEPSFDRIPAAEPDAGAERPGGLPSVEGLDWDYAFLHLPGEDLLEIGIRDFYELLPLQEEKLDAMARELRAADSEEARSAAVDAYRIQVHGMKSGAATIGIVSIAGMAAVLEGAARDKRCDDVLSAHPVFIRAWHSYLDILRGVFGVGETAEEENLETADPAAVSAMLGILKSQMEEMDVDGADQTVAELMKFSYPPEAREHIGKLKAAVTDLDDAAVNELADAIIAEMG